MSQTVGGEGFSRAEVLIGTDSAVGTDISGQGAAVMVTGGERVVQKGDTFEGDTPILAAGKRGSLNIEVRFLYTKVAEEAFEIARAIYETEGGACFLAYSPGGGDSGDFDFFSAKQSAKAAGIMKNFIWPSGEVNSTDLIPGGFTLEVSEILKAASAV